MTIGKRMRFEILKRDGFRCMYCGKRGNEKGLHVDHIIPRSKGGTDEPSNLVAACRDCNTGKSNVALETVHAPSTDVDGVVDDALDEAAHEAQERHRFLSWMFCRALTNKFESGLPANDPDVLRALELAKSHGITTDDLMRWIPFMDATEQDGL